MRYVTELRIVSKCWKPFSDLHRQLLCSSIDFWKFDQILRSTSCFLHVLICIEQSIHMQKWRCLFLTDLFHLQLKMVVEASDLTKFHFSGNRTYACRCTVRSKRASWNFVLNSTASRILEGKHRKSFMIS